jgi:hypothetical protein
VAVSSGRFIRDLTDVSDITGAVSAAASATDRAVHRLSVRVAGTLHSAAPDAVPLTAVVVPTAFTFFKSARWGPFAAARNAVLVFGITSCAVFPDRVRAATIGRLFPADAVKRDE